MFGDIWWGNGTKTGNFVPNVIIKGNFISLFGVYTYNGVEFLFQYLKNKPPFNNETLRTELLVKLNAALKTDMNTVDKRPNLRMVVFEKPGAMDAFFEVVEWYIDTVKSFYSK